MKINQNLKGFTLVELLVVVLIIGILSAVALPQYQVAVAKAKIARMQPLVKMLRDAQEVYYLEQGRYATYFSDLSVDIPEAISYTDPWESDDGCLHGQAASYGEVNGHQVQLISLSCDKRVGFSMAGLLNYYLPLSRSSSHSFSPCPVGKAIMIVAKNNELGHRIVNSMNGEQINSSDSSDFYCVSM